MSEDVLTNLKLLKMIKKNERVKFKTSKELIDTVHEYFNGLYIITLSKGRLFIRTRSISKSITANKEAIL